MAFDLSPLTFGTVSGLFGGAGGDGLDLDTNPDGYVATGSFTFTPNVSYLKSTSPSKRIDILAVTATIDINGNLSRNGASGVTLVATDGTLAAAANLQYTVTSTDYSVNGVKQPFDAITIQVPAAGVDLIQAIPVLRASIVTPATATINDAVTASSSVWSSTKTAQAIGAAVGGATGASINDTTASTTSTYSSSKTNTVVTAGALALISDTATDTTHTWSASKITSALSTAGGGTARLSRNIYWDGTKWVNEDGTTITTRPSTALPVTIYSTKNAGVADPTWIVVGDMRVRHPDDLGL